jgi:parvulin-like peptidyl-prolyl isomerase
MKAPMKLSIGSIFVTIFFGAALAQPPAQQPPAKPPALRPTLAQPGQAKPAEGPLVIVSPDTVVLTIGSEKMTRAQFEELLTALAENGRPATTPAAKRQVAEQLGELRSLSQEARRRKLEQLGTVQQMITIQADNVLAGALSRQISAEANPDEAAQRAYYDQNKLKFEQAKASHILIRFKGSRVPLKAGQKDLTEEEALAKAQDIRKKILAGGDFAALAKTESDDTGTAVNGGSLGTFARGAMAAEFEKAAFSQPVGEVGEPVKTQFGYHIVKVEERKSKSFEEARPEVVMQLKPQLTRDTMDRLKKQTPVTLDDGYFGKQ